MLKSFNESSSHNHLFPSPYIYIISYLFINMRIDKKNLSKVLHRKLKYRCVLTFIVLLHLILNIIRCYIVSTEYEVRAHKRRYAGRESDRRTSSVERENAKRKPEDRANGIPTYAKPILASHCVRAARRVSR